MGRFVTEKLAFEQHLEQAEYSLRALLMHAKSLAVEDFHDISILRTRLDELRKKAKK